MNLTWEEIDAVRHDPQRLEKMKPVLDRIPPEWGKYLPDPGWDDILLELDAKLAEFKPDYVIHQAKEKFGTLRFYCDLPYTDQPTTEIIRAAENKSETICEWCGQPGKLRSGGWYKTYCDEHAAG